ncbi:MAG: hypothetical protein P8Q97_00940 [Myxococcota bacterium]|jgi:hypothetical protein|nr:hypothetical protein [Myxococcota bacterium]
MDVKIKLQLEFTVTGSGIEDAFEEFDELTVEGLMNEILDKNLACDSIVSKVVEGPNSLEEYDEHQKLAAG